MGPLPSGGPALFSLKYDTCIEPDTVHCTARALVRAPLVGIKQMFANATERNRKNPEKVGQCVGQHDRACVAKLNPGPRTVSTAHA